MKKMSPTVDADKITSGNINEEIIIGTTAIILNSPVEEDLPSTPRRSSSSFAVSKLHKWLANFCNVKNGSNEDRTGNNDPSGFTSNTGNHHNHANSTSHHNTALEQANWCVETIEAAGDDKLKGVYVQNGKITLVEKMKECFEKGEAPSLADDQTEFDYKAVASLLKRHVRRQPKSIIPDSLYNDLVAACNDFAKTQSRVKLRYAMRKLPPKNYQLAKLLLCHFWRISTQRSVALVTPVSLAISWSPNLFDMNSIAGQFKHSELAVYEASLAIAIRNFISETLITQANVIFQ